LRIAASAAVNSQKKEVIHRGEKNSVVMMMNDTSKYASIAFCYTFCSSGIA